MKKDLISITDYTKEEYLRIMELAAGFEKEPNQDLLKGKVVASLFFEPSTRTRLSFETAISRLGGRIIGFADAGSSSVTKGESLHDTIRMVTNYADLIVMRHPLEGAARYAAEIATVPVINAGDGTNQHPSQTLLDLVTIYETQGSLSGLKIAMCGDLKYGRTVHSLAQALKRWGCEFAFVSPPTLAMPDYITEELEEAGCAYQILPTLEDAVEWADILYMTRVQRERFFNEADYVRLKDSYILTPDKLIPAKSDLSILHPLPRVNEISVAIDNDPRACYFKQVRNGKYIRMALILKLLGVM